MRGRDRKRGRTRGKERRERMGNLGSSSRNRT